MAKTKRLTIGSVYRAKEQGKPPYIKINVDVSVQKGQILQLQSKQNQLDSLDKALNEGKLSEDLVVKIRERVLKIPDYVLFEIVLLQSNE